MIVTDEMHERFWATDSIEEALNNKEITIEDIDEMTFDINEDFVRDVYDVKDVEIIFKCEHQKALRIMKLLFSMNYALKMGKSYYVKRDEFERFFTNFQGKEIAI